MGFFSKLLSVGESKPLKNYQRRVAEVNAFEPAMQARSDEELAHLTVEFRAVSYTHQTMPTICSV